MHSEIEADDLLGKVQQQGEVELWGDTQLRGEEKQWTTASTTRRKDWSAQEDNDFQWLSLYIEHRRRSAVWNGKIGADKRRSAPIFFKI